MMGFFQAVRRHEKWPVRLSLYDGRACPDCGAIVVGRDDRQAHRESHIRQTEFDSAVREFLRRLAEHTGMGYQLPEGESPAYDQEPDDDEIEEVDGYVV
jgi:hypothetical protein